jgi:ubiquinone/menaquinone biosynthesis C-methylase UbiE
MDKNKNIIQKSITSYWDKLADKYDTYIRRGILTYDEKINWYKTLLELLSDQPLKILDAGSGTGNMSILLSQLGHKVTGIDLSIKSLSIAKNKAFKLSNKPKFIYADATNPPFRENSFDVIFSRYLLWTLTEPDKAFSAWNRVLKPLGKLIIIDGLWKRRRSKTEKLSDDEINMEKIFICLPLYLTSNNKNLEKIRGAVKRGGFKYIRFKKIEKIDRIHQQFYPSLKSHYVLIANKPSKINSTGL